MAPSSLPSSIGNAFSSHKQASIFLFATLAPFFLPLLIICVPFFLLLLAPLSSLLLSLLLLYKLQASIRSRCSWTGKKGSFGQQIGGIGGPHLEEMEGRRFQVCPESAEELDAANVQSLAASDIGSTQSNVSDSVREEPSDVEGHDARDVLEKEQAEGDSTEGIAENRQEEFFDSHRDPENEGSHVFASPISRSPIEHTKKEQDFNIEGMPFGREEKPAEMREDSVTEESSIEGMAENSQEESFDFYGDRKHEGLHVRASPITESPIEHMKKEQEGMPLDQKEKSANMRESTMTEGILREGMAKNRQEESSYSHGDHDEKEGSHVFASPITESPIEHIKKEQDFRIEGRPLDQEEKPAETREEMREDNVTEGSSIEGMAENRQEESSYPYGDPEKEGSHVLASPISESSIEHMKKEQDFSLEGMPLNHEKPAEMREDNVTEGSSIEGMAENRQEELSYSYGDPEEEGSHVLASPMSESLIEHLKKEQDFNTEGMPLDQEEKPAEMREANVTEGMAGNRQEVLSHSYGDPAEMREANVTEGMAGNRQEVLSHSYGDPAEGGSHVLVSPITKSPIEHTKKEQEFDIQGLSLDQEEKPAEGREDNVSEVSTQDDFLTPCPSIQAQGSLQAMLELGSDRFYDVVAEEQGNDSGKDSPAVEPYRQESVAKFEEVPWKGSGDESFQIDTPHTLDTQPHGRHDPVLSSEKQSGSTTADFGLGKPEEHDLRSSEMKDLQEGEASCSSTDGFEPGRAEAFAKEHHDDALPQQGMLDSNSKESFEWDRPFETSSSAASSTQRPFEGVESQDKTQEEHRILADISAIKKIVGYQGEAHASAMEQITALFLFLGMEPDDCDAEVDDLERARAAIELLKVVVGVK